MSLFDKIRSAFAGKPVAAERDTDRVYIVDGDRLVEGGDRLGPSERFQVLQRLSRFVQREKVQMRVVLGGRPLREVGHGGDFNGLQVYYSEQVEGIGDQVLSLVRGAREKNVIITSDVKLEARALEQGAQVMKTATLRKGFDGGGNGDSENGGGRQRRRDRGRRDRGRRPDRPDQSGEPRDQRDGGGQEHRPEPGNETTVKNLIDLVE